MEKGLLMKIFDYYANNSELRDKIFDALKVFFNKPNLNEKREIGIIDENDEARFNEWFIFNFKIKDNKTPLEYFCEINPYNLPRYRLQKYIDLLDNEYGFFEVLEVKIGEGLELKNLGNGNEYWVKEYSGTFDSEKGLILTGRIGKIEDHFELIGIDPYCFP
jgi:hypothetical protein